MTTNSETQTIEYQQTVLSIMRRLPLDRLPYLVEFAQFLEFQAESSGPMDDEGTDFESDGDAKWDELLARPESKRVLHEMARDARAEYNEGRTTEIGISDDGLLVPK